jgi:hypothetical protein
MKNARIPLILASVGLPLLMLVSTVASAGTTTADEGKPAAMPAASAATDKTAAVTDAQASDAKPGRLRYRSATSSGCTSAKGGVGEADIRRAEEARTSDKN